MSGDTYVYERAEVEVRVSYLRVEFDGPTLRRIAGNHASVAGRYQETSLTGNHSSSNLTNDKWTPSNQPIYPMPEFKPKYSIYGNNYVNAINEIKGLWEYVIKEALHNYSDMYSQLRIPMTNDIKRTCQKHKEVYAVYDKKTKKWLVESNEPQYKYCYNGEDFVEFEVAKNKVSGNRLLLVGKYAILMQEPNLVRETRTASSIITFQRPSMRLIVGVPGCGKTTYIISNHTRGSLVLTSCAEGAADIRSRMEVRNNGISSKLRDSYRTIDSYLLHSRRRYREVWIDEALMEHPGKLFLVCFYTQCQVMHMLGDPNQLGYINRVNSIDLHYDKSSSFFAATSSLNTSYRCPVDVMAIITKKYDGGAYSTSNVLRSMTCKQFTSLENVAKEDDTKYLVFKQAEKREMKKAGYNVSTIHEFQGKEAKNVVIVRMSRNVSEPLYESPAHILVGMTRHTKSLVYYTPVKDVLHKLMNTPLTHAQLLKHQKLIKSPFTQTQNNYLTVPRNRVSSSASNNISSSAMIREENLMSDIFTGVVSIIRWAAPIVGSGCRWIWDQLKVLIEPDDLECVSPSASNNISPSAIIAA